MAGSSSNWFKLTAGPMKGKRVFISNATLQKYYPGYTKQAAIYEISTKPKPAQRLQSLAKKSAQPAGQAKAKQARLDLSGPPAPASAAVRTKLDKSAASAQAAGLTLPKGSKAQIHEATPMLLTFTSKKKYDQAYQALKSAGVLVRDFSGVTSEKPGQFYKPNQRIVFVPESQKSKAKELGLKDPPKGYEKKDIYALVKPYDFSSGTFTATKAEAARAAARAKRNS